jgi:soluble lytic murein transglycosylase
MKIKRQLLCLFLSTLCSCCLAFGNEIEQQRQDFLLAEKMLAQGKESEFLRLSSQLISYPLYPYLHYQWLKINLSQTDAIKAFLIAYKDTRYAEPLRSQWLDYLADNERWEEFVENYHNADTLAQECQFYWANYKLGHQSQPLADAMRLWLTGDNLPKECNSLMLLLELSPLLTPELIWQRFELALKNNNKPLMNSLRYFFDAPSQITADLWLQIHKNPTIIQNSQFLVDSDIKGSIFAYGLKSLAQSDLETAVKVWDNKKSQGYFNKKVVQQIERILGLALAHARDERAYDHLSIVSESDSEIREWKIRSALYALNWQRVNHALAELSNEEKLTPQWQYWQARASIEIGDVQHGQAIFQSLANDRSFYGFMAADAVNKPYAFSDHPVNLLGDELTLLAEQVDFQVAHEFIELKRDLDAKRQWWFAVNKLSKQQRKVAAKLAQQWQWDQVAIMTLVKADYWDDLALRFPLRYSSQIQLNAYSVNLEPAVVFGLIRQESMLDPNAMSAVGARGLMQIMPETGKEIAGELNTPWQAANSLFVPDINIRYGTYYFKRLLDKFDGHFALATAAYNAGPNRVNKWLPTDRSLPTDVWVETIPFKETRKYVSAVLAYTIIYQQRLQSNGLKMRELLPDMTQH